MLLTGAEQPQTLSCLTALRRQQQLPIRLLTVTTEPLAAGCYLADGAYRVPPCTGAEYVPALLAICRHAHVQVLFPTSTPEIPILAAHAPLFAEYGIRIIAPPLAAVQTVIDKWAMYQFLQALGIDTPPTWLVEAAPTTLRYPLFLKPRYGYASHDCFTLDAPADLDFYSRRLSQPGIVQPCITAPEFTVDLLTAPDGRVLVALARERIQTTHGLTVITRTVSNVAILPLLEHLVRRLGLWGSSNVQYFQTLEGRQIFDVNLCISGSGIPMGLAVGINLPLLILQQALHLPVKPMLAYPLQCTLVRYFADLVIPPEQRPTAWDPLTQ